MFIQQTALDATFICFQNKAQFFLQPWKVEIGLPPKLGVRHAQCGLPKLRVPLLECNPLHVQVSCHLSFFVSLCRKLWFEELAYAHVACYAVNNKFLFASDPDILHLLLASMSPLQVTFLLVNRINLRPLRVLDRFLII